MSYVIPNETPGHPMSQSRDGDKAQPAATVHSSSFSRAVTPAETVVTRAPNHVIINQTGSFSFAYSCKESLGASRDSSSHYWEQAVVFDVSNAPEASFSPTRLDISPCAWSGSGAIAGATGDVTFVYKGV